jgi:hypothetical protein
MALYSLIVVSGIALSAALIAILTALSVFSLRRRVLCLKSRQDAECTTTCIRSCHLATGSTTSSAGPAGRARAPSMLATNATGR